METFKRIFLVIVIMWTCQLEFLQGTSVSTKSVQYKKVKSNSKLNGNITATHTDKTLQKCAAFGSENGIYPAFNYYKPTSSNQTGTCEVLSVNRRSAPLVAANGYTYYELDKTSYDFCISNPCLHTGKCNNIDTEFGPDFNCTCPFPLGGKTCSDLICQSCEQNNDLVIFWNITKSTIWIESYEYCRSRGWTLYLDKTKEKHNIAVEIGKKLFPDINNQVCFWLGMNRTSAFAKWTYVDGTKLTTSFTKWASGRPTTANCVEMANGPTFLWNWDDEECDAGGSWSYYPLCEQTYPFLLQ